MIAVKNKWFRKAAGLMLMAFLVNACSEDEGQDSGQRPGGSSSVIPAVEAVEARYGSLPLSERLSGTVIAENQVELYPEINGRIGQVMVNDGDKVEKGDPLVQLNDEQYREQVQQAEAGRRISNARLKQANARLQQLQAEYKRTKTLAERDLSSELEIETLEARMASARADVELAEAELERAVSTLEEQREQLARTVIRAPIAGSIGQRNAEMGMQVSTNTHLFTIGNLDKLRVEVILTEQKLNRIEVGQTAQIYLPDEEREGEPVAIRATLSRISPFLNPIARSTEAEIEVDNADGLLRPGMFVPVDILYGESSQATLLPTSALYTDPATGEEGVYVASALGSEVQPAEGSGSEGFGLLTEPTDVQFKKINVVARGRMEVGVTGIESGQWVVTVGQHLLSGGRQQARVRTSSWERILTLQGFQRQDLLRNVLDSQNTQTSQTTL